jgi:exosome complex component RRP41
MTYTKRFDGRDFDEMRKIETKIGVVPNADGSAYFAFGETKAIAAVYGPRTLHPQHLKNPQRGVLRCHYDMISFSVTERKKPGPNRRSSEISYVTSGALSEVVQLDNFPNSVIDVFITIIQADASTRCAGINAASMALAHAGIPMTGLVSAVSVGNIGGAITVDMIKEEEDYEENGEKYATDTPMAFLPNGGISLLQLDGKTSPEMLKKAIAVGRKACMKITEIQKKALKSLGEDK